MHSQIMSEMSVAKAWGMTPSQFQKLSTEDQAFMMAYEQAMSEITSAQEFIADEKAKDAAKSAKRKSGRGRS